MNDPIATDNENSVTGVEVLRQESEGQLNDPMTISSTWSKAAFKAPLLPLRPQPQVGENFTAYLTRLSAANHLAGITAMAKYLKVTRAELMTMSPKALQCLLRGDRTLADAHCSRYAKQSGVVRVRPDATSEKTRICCICFKEGRPHLEVWDRPLSVVCEIHRVCLIDQCPVCHKCISHLRRHVSICGCGTDWRRHSPSAEPKWLKQFYEIFGPWRLLGTLEPHDHLEDEQQGLGILMSLLVPRSDRKGNESHKGFIESTKKLDLSRISEIGDLLNEWPRNFQRRVLAMYGTSIHVGSKLKRAIASSPLELLRTAIKGVLEKRGRRNPTNQNQRRLVPITSVRELVHLTGLHQGAVVKAIQDGVIKCKKTRTNSPKAKQKIEVSMADSKRLRALHRCSVEFKPAALRLGCAPCHLRLFAFSGLLPVTRFTARTFGWRFRIKHLDQLAARLEALALPENEAAGLLKVFTSVATHEPNSFPNATWIEWVTKIFKGQVPLYRLAGGATGFASLAVRVLDLPRRGRYTSLRTN